MKVYLANSLFSEADQMYNSYLVDELRKAFDINFYMPQENEEINDKQSYASSLMISKGDDENLLDSDFMIAVIDGGTIDEGVACEIGKFHGYHIAYQEMYNEFLSHEEGNSYVLPPIFALFTDIRQQGRNNTDKLKALVGEAVENQFPYRNLYVIGTIKDSGGLISSSVEELIEDIDEYISTLDKSL